MTNLPGNATVPKRPGRLLVLGAALSVLAACSAGSVKPDDTSAVERRAVERWNHLIAHEAEQAYDYLTPGYRETIAREAYAAAMNSRPVRWETVKYESGECEEDRCSVILNVGYSLRMASAAQTVQAASPQRENWIRVKGVWYFLPND
jgi:ribonuclease HI